MQSITVYLFLDIGETLPMSCTRCVVPIVTYDY